MAKKSNEICDIVKKCKILLLDIEGTTTSISFVKDNLFPYAEGRVKEFLENNWEESDVKEAVTALRKQAAEDQEKSLEGVVTIPGEDAGKDEQIDGLVKSVKWQMSADRKAGALKLLQGLIWKLGYDNGDIKGHVYEDVSPALELWRSVEGQKVYIYSSGSVQAQKLLFAKSVAGDMLPLIDGHFDTAVGAKQEAASYLAIAEQTGSKPEEILFLTDILKEAEAAQASGLQAALVSREGNAPLPDVVALPVIHSFDQLAVTNKRKPDAQVEEVPAKVPKTDAKDDVKTAPQANGGTKTSEAEAVEKPDEKMEMEEKMEVEDPTDISSTKLTNKETGVAEIPASEADISDKDVPMADADEPAVPAVNIEVVAAEVDTAEANTPSPATETNVDSTDNVVVESIAETTSVASLAGAKDEEATTESKIVTTPLVEAATLDIPMESKVDADSNTNELLVAESKIEDGSVTDLKVNPDVAEIKPIEASTVTPSLDAATPIEETITQDIAIVAESTAERDTITTSQAEEKVAVEENKSKPVEPLAMEIIATFEFSATVTTEVSGTKSEVTTSEKVDIHVQDGIRTDTTIKVSVDSSATVHNETATNAEDENVEVKEVSEEEDDSPPTVIETIIEKNAEKTDSSETDTMETDDSDDKNIETATEPKEPEEIKESVTENITIITEVQDITDDKESLNEVTDIIEDLVPIVEEPSHLEEMEKLQNAGDVLEKECDEILSKVQDVTGLDYNPVKPLHTIAEEMETENIDSNDIVDRILDTEMELSMKPCEDIELNEAQEINQPKTDVSDEKLTDIPIAAADSAPEKMELTSTEITDKIVSEIKNDINDEAKNDKSDETLEVAEASDSKPKIDSGNNAEVNTVPDNSKKESTDETVTLTEDNASAEAAVASETKANEVSQDTQKNATSAEPKLNGNATNGGAAVKLNGDSNIDELQSRLSVENGKEKVNGSNGTSIDGENGKGDNKMESEIPDIKVKSVVDEPRTNPIEHPVEA